MPKKKQTISKSQNAFEKYQHYFIPSTIGGAIAAFFSASILLGFLVFFAVWFGNWIGHSFLKKK